MRINLDLLNTRNEGIKDFYQEYILTCLNQSTSSKHYISCINNFCKCSCTCIYKKTECSVSTFAPRIDCVNYITLMFRNPEYAMHRYSCIPITFAYIFRYSNRYASEIYYIVNYFDLLSDFSSEQQINVLSIGCGPATEVIALECLSKEQGKNINYIGFDMNPVWHITQSIMKDVLKDFSSCTVDFYNMKLTSNCSLLEHTHILILNYVVSDIYKHSDDPSVGVTAFLGEVQQMFECMPDNSYIIINDVNSCNMGRDEIEAWSQELPYEKSYGIFDYADRKFRCKFNQHQEQFKYPLFFSLPESLELDDFSEYVTECRSAFVVIKKTQNQERNK